MSEWIDPKVRPPEPYFYCVLSFEGMTAEGYLDWGGRWYLSREPGQPLKAIVNRWKLLPDAAPEEKGKP